MGKKQHSKDQLYLTASEWKQDWGGKKDARHLPYKTLPFDCCAISFRPFENPMCTADGIVFDLVHIVPYLKKFKRHPVTGEPLSASDLTKLHFHKNVEGKYACPVLYKTFNQHSHIVAIKTTGNVYSYEAVKELNLKAASFLDLLDSTPFKRSDIITIQDPSDGSKRELDKFNHVTQKLSAKPAEDKGGVNHNDAMARVMSQLSKSKAAPASASKPAEATTAGFSAPEKKGAVSNSSKPRWLQTTGQAAASFTSTNLTPQTENTIAKLSEEEVSKQRYAFLKKKKRKGYAQLQTSKGNINLELHVEIAPMTCENFIQLCETGYYRGVSFHRLIRNFMLQGGDPTGTGTGGESIWKKQFKDELSAKYRHEGRGVLSMANSGPGTNGSQFFITFKSAPHLDGKHTIFGRVVGGFDVLARIEQLPTDAEDRPLEQILITNALVLENPFERVDEHMAEEQAREDDPVAFASVEAAKQREQDTEAWYTTPATREQPLREGVGKYIAQKHFEAASAQPGSSALAAASSVGSSSLVAAALEIEQPKAKKAKKAAGGFGDFSSW